MVFDDNGSLVSFKGDFMFPELISYIFVGFSSHFSYPNISFEDEALPMKTNMDTNTDNRALCLNLTIFMCPCLGFIVCITGLL